MRIVNTPGGDEPGGDGPGGDGPGGDGEELNGAWGRAARPAGEGTGRRTDFVQSLDRGLAVIRCFSS